MDIYDFNSKAICTLFLMLVMMMTHVVIHILFNIEWFEKSNNRKWMSSQLLTWFFTALILMHFIEGS